LLRIDLFESDAEVIDNAYDKEMSNLKLQEHGSHADLVEPLTRQLFAARKCLLDAKSKATYDAELRVKLAIDKDSDNLAPNEIDPRNGDLALPDDEHDRTLGRPDTLEQATENRLTKEILPPPLPRGERRHRKPKPRVAAAGLAPLKAVDQWLSNLAGHGNTSLHYLLRVVALALGILTIFVVGIIVWLATNAPEPTGPNPGR